VTASLQRQLLDSGEPSFDAAFDGVERFDLGRGAWIDFLPRWVRGSDRLFEDLEAGVGWQRHQMMMYDRMVEQPRLSAPLTPEEWARWPALSAIAAALSERYRKPFTTCWVNLYRDGKDGVAWHGDRTGRRELEALVAIISLGEPRRFLIRPKGGGESRRFDLGRGDLLVMGGTCQRTFEHSVPKTKRAGPRISVTFRPVAGT
jgi:alkylated DNA repair dioxygenase AlkB